MNESKSDSDAEDTALVLTTDSIYITGSNRTWANLGTAL